MQWLLHPMLIHPVGLQVFLRDTRAASAEVAEVATEQALCLATLQAGSWPGIPLPERLRRSSRRLSRYPPVPQGAPDETC